MHRKNGPPPVSVYGSGSGYGYGYGLRDAGSGRWLICAVPCILISAYMLLGDTPIPPLLRNFTYWFW